MNIQQQLTRIFQKVFDDGEIELKPEMTSGDIEGWIPFTRRSHHGHRNRAQDQVYDQGAAVTTEHSRPAQVH